MDYIYVGKMVEKQKIITHDDILLFADVTGDFNSLHINKEKAKEGPFGEIIAHGILSVGIISGVIGMELPGEGSIYLEQNAKFIRPVYVDELITVHVEVKEIVKKEKGIIKLITNVINKGGELLLEGMAVVKVDPKRLK